ncbi:bifunctional folylpolyglutamate synthase/dihydrofolate synthase [Streptococcus suis]|nr:bifunctional folylpolyglutamate synthase/dihydrofolate synthase [Streptococcus suis]
MRYALELLGNPQEKVPLVHVAGTNGKGSTLAFLQKILESHGLRVGRFVSPHMVTIEDRILIQSEPIPTSLFLELVRQVHDLEVAVAQVFEGFRYFEVMVLVMFLYFQDQDLDLALIEVGIGGLHDSTNVIDPLMSLITSIGLDHQDLLGETIEDIAYQKAGIIKPHRLVLLGDLPLEAQQVCLQVASDKEAEVYQFGLDFGWKKDLFWSEGVEIHLDQLGLPGNHQRKNAALAVEASRLLLPLLGKKWKRECLASALAETSWMGRLELLVSDPAIYLDGAHNLPAIESLAAFIKEGDGPRTILFSALKRKDFQEMLACLERELPEATLVLTSFSYDGAVKKEDLLWQGDWAEDYQVWLATWLKEGQGRLFVTGSLYFISEVRKWLLDQKNKKLDG